MGDVCWNQPGELRSWETQFEGRIDWSNNLSTGYSHLEEYRENVPNPYRKVPFYHTMMDFRNRITALILGYRMREWQSLLLKAGPGRNYERDLEYYSIDGKCKLTKKWSLEYSGERIVFVPDPVPGGETTWIHIVKSYYFFTPDFYTKLFYQIRSNSEASALQLITVYRYDPPFGFVQFAFQQSDPGKMLNDTTDLFVKFSFMF
jgi:hypothetical protein